MQQNLKIIEEQKNKIIGQQTLKNDLTLIVTSLEEFAAKLTLNLENLDWATKRDIIKKRDSHMNCVNAG